MKCTPFFFPNTYIWPILKTSKRSDKFTQLQKENAQQKVWFRWKAKTFFTSWVEDWARGSALKHKMNRRRHKIWDWRVTYCLTTCRNVELGAELDRPDLLNSSFNSRYGFLNDLRRKTLFTKIWKKNMDVIINTTPLIFEIQKNLRVQTPILNGILYVLT